MSTHVVGLDLGGTSVKAVSLTRQGVELARGHHPFDLEQPGAFVEAMKTALSALEDQVGTPAAAVGISAPGLAARDGTCVAFMPGRFPGLAGLNWAHALHRDRVPVLNDAQAALLGEVWCGAAQGASQVVMLTLGTGVGGAALVDGRLLQGRSGKAGHLGHVSLDPAGRRGITGVPGSLEDAIGNHNIRQRTAGRFDTTLALIHAHQQGDAEASRVWLESVRALAAALTSFTNILDPERIVIGGGIASCGDTLFLPLRRWVAEWEWQVGAPPVAIVPAELGDRAGAVGAAWHALRESAETESSGG
ncbi:MAG: ROK family protein [Verrucomicrobiales bacterium]|nr:ROK family protein [Verrucomicrobiales bacterium]